MSSEEFNFDKYLEKIRLDIVGGKDSFIAHSSDKEESLIFVDNSLECISVAKESLVPHLVAYNKNPFWVAFVNDWKPSFDIVGSYKENFLKLAAIMQIIVEEVRINGRTSSVMRVVYNNIEEISSLSSDDEKHLFFSCLSAYERFDKSSVLFWRLENKFEEINEDYVNIKFKEVEDNTKALNDSLQKQSRKFRERIAEIDHILEAMKGKAGFLSLYAGFDKYATQINKKISWLRVERALWVFSILATILLGLYYMLSNEVDWFSLTPLVGLILFFSMLLRVNLKKTDQYEQIMSKVEHKLAVSTFYQSELNKLEGKEKVNEEYYKFLFSDIETTEWNTPDIASDIAKIFKSYNSR
ncbi:hypothetical protein HVA01_16320 [Halovibrio variabilis]|uniref:Uncharacterized protein n=1 Tax=Halovibrio variabilis TaxID=31910 RepID=A0A511UMZ6_9GAMM|nr:hypothetical protein [Halovibrio variabilis]GEN27986.1 hypothetical protein HVA01_16320 [Halovibrio variabilis]